MDVNAYLEERLGKLHDNGNYRVFADLERQAGAFRAQPVTAKMVPFRT